MADTFIENSKAIFDDDSTEEQKESAKQTLYTAIEGGLTMIHPFMPFLTEELWQRLPRREGDKTPSITVAAYPEYREDFDDTAAEAEYDLLVDTSAGIRSLITEYGIKKNVITFVQALDESTHKVLSLPTSLPTLRSLTLKTKSDINVLSPSDAAPTGCAIYTVGSSATVFLELKGRVDIDNEIIKARTKLQKADKMVENQKKIMGVADYQGKVSDAVKEGDAEKLKAAEIESGNLQRSLEQFEKLKIGE